MDEPRVVHSADEIRQRLNEVATRISEDYQGKKLILVGILKGAAFLLADLARLIRGPVDFEFVDVTVAHEDRGEIVHLTFATHIEVSGRHVLVLKDVCHSGVTENYLITHLSQQHPASIEVVALVDRPHLRSVNLPAKYAVFRDDTDGYLVGYGLGLEWGKYTNRPELCAIERA
jgi:hypoxanthine phosphoribosyltransferase